MSRFSLELRSRLRAEVLIARDALGVVMQYRESDYDFIRRLLAQEGLNFFFAHAGGHARSSSMPNRKIQYGRNLGSSKRAIN